jgi:hypothetical protein
MRPLRILVVATLLVSTGCSWLVANSGQQLGELKTREQVHAAFGPPATAGHCDQRTYEEFHTRRKIAEPWKGMGLGMGWCLTFGLGEAYFFPHETVVAARRSIVGQRLVFYYDEAGKVQQASHDGDPIPWIIPSQHSQSEPPPEGESSGDR